MELQTDLALVTANFGGIDNIKAFPADAGFDAFYYTDAATLAGGDADSISSWTQVVVPSYPHQDFGPRLRAKYFKQQIHRLPELLPYRWLAWADSTVQIKRPKFLLNAVAKLRNLPSHRRFLLIPHPTRTTLRAESESVIRDCRQGDTKLGAYMRARYVPEELEHQMKVYRAEGWNLDAPLWCGTMWLLERNEITARCMDEWWHHTIRFGVMDQLSLPIVLEQCAVKPTVLKVNLIRNPLFYWSKHARLM